MTALPPGSLAQRLADAASANPTRWAINSMGSPISHAEFQSLTRSLALHLRARGIGQRARLGLSPDHPIVMLGLAMACSLLGCSWISATSATLANRQARITHLLYLGARPEGATGKAFQVDPGWYTPPPGVPADFPGYASPRDPWMIAQSSGTTGEPKMIPLTEQMFLDRIDGGHHVPHPANPVLLCMFPLLSYPNIINAVRTIAQGGTILYGDPASLFGKMQIDVLNGAPSQFATFMNTLAASVLNAQGPQIGAARVTGATAGPAFYARLRRHARHVVNVYSSTEAAVHCARIIDNDDLAITMPSVGQPVEGCVLEIVDADDHVLQAGAEGIVRLRTPGMTTGYSGEPGLTAHVFRNGFFHPGDIGRIAENGDLILTGRVHDLINIGGVKRNAALIDDRICAVAGIMDAACFELPSQQGVPLLAVALRLGPSMQVAPLIPHLTDAVVSAFGAVATPRQIYVVGEIPRNANGKVLRHELPGRVADLPFVTVPG